MQLCCVFLSADKDEESTQDRFVNFGTDTFSISCLSGFQYIVICVQYLLSLKGGKLAK